MMQSPTMSTGPLILLVDDDEGARDAAAECLVDEGYDVRVASNGQDALELLDTLRPALLVVDWRMPVMSGQELLSSMRADTSLAAVPALILTASHAWEIAVPNATFLQKPVRMQALRDAVRACLQRAG